MRFLHNGHRCRPFDNTSIPIHPPWRNRTAYRQEQQSRAYPCSLAPDPAHLRSPFGRQRRIPAVLRSHGRHCIHIPPPKRTLAARCFRTTWMDMEIRFNVHIMPAHHRPDSMALFRNIPSVFHPHQHGRPPSDSNHRPPLHSRHSTEPYRIMSWHHNKKSRGHHCHNDRCPRDNLNYVGTLLGFTHASHRCTE